MSALIGWAILAAWVIGFVITARKVSQAMITTEEASTGKVLNTEDRAANRIFGCLIGIVWPLLLLGAAVTGKLPRTDLQLKARRENLASEIAELEAENERLRREQEAIR